MKRLYTMLSVLVLASMLLAACAPATTEAPATEPPHTEAPPTEAPATEAPPAFECTDAIGCVDIAPGEPIHIAWIQSVSGATAALGQTNVNGGQIAIDDKGGELLGHPIQYDGEDSLCNAEGGQAAGTKIVADPTVVAILGTTCSSEARAAMPLVADAGMVMMSPSNTNPDLTNPDHPDHHDGYFRTAHNDLFQGRVAAEYAFNELGFTSAATVHDGSPYAQSLQQVFADVFTELGGTITAQEAVNVGDTDFKPVLTTIAAGSPEIIYFPIFEPEGNLMASQKCEVSGLEEVSLMGADGLFTSGFPTTAGSCAVGMYMSSPYVAGDAMAGFLEKYNTAFGEGPASGFAPHAYDAINMFFAAIEQVAVVGADGTVHIPRQALRDALYGTTGFTGLTGNLACDENGDCATGEALAVYQLSQAMVDGSEDLVASTPIWQP
ncbi:MAG: ABC transporter substrate-binding protein [Anaerolineae bacterium]|nr:ABC transporter substrate-binding protein [Anaerolineae bacterium]MCI0609211.1 ABC transporter substrate-binding protein [Anaerolineae bacterium]